MMEQTVELTSAKHQEYKQKKGCRSASFFQIISMINEESMKIMENDMRLPKKWPHTETRGLCF